MFSHDFDTEREFLEMKDLIDRLKAVYDRLAFQASLHSNPELFNRCMADAMTVFEAADALERLNWQNERAFWVRPDGEHTTIPPEPPKSGE